MSSIQLIRHAESEGNAGLPTHDPASIPLTQRGHEQATALAATFTAAPDLIVVSWPLFGMQDGVIHCQIRVEKTSKFAKQ